MTMTIDEALAQAEEMSSNSDWTILTGYVNKPMYSDSEVSVDLYSKTIGDLSENVSTTEENNSEYISFIMDRYHDGVDLSTMLIQLQYELEDGSGSIDGVVNAYMNDDQIKFGWVVPNTVTQQSRTIKIMIFCTGELADGNSYLLKTLPVEYTINKTLNIGGSIPEPDENWYLQFANTMQKNVLAAKESADAAAQSASDASDDLVDIKNIQADVNTSKSTVQTLAAQVQSNATKAQESADAAKVSEDTAKSWAERAQESSGVNYASKQLAGIVAPQDVYVNPENGHMSIITQTTDTTLSNSCAGGIKVDEIDGGSEQGSTTGAQLFDISTVAKGYGVSNSSGNLYASSNLFATDYMKVNGLSSIIANAVSDAAGNIWGAFYDSDNVFISGFTVKDKIVPIVENAIYVRLTFMNSYLDTDIMVNAGDTLLPWEPYTGGVASPNPDYPQEIESVGGSSINMLDFYGTDVLTGYFVNANGCITTSVVGNDTWIIEVKPNTEYVISRKLYENIGTMVVAAFTEYPVAGTTGTALGNVDSTQLYFSFTTPDDAKYIAMFSGGLNQAAGAEKGRLMLNKGAIPIPYVPYGVTITLRTHGKNLCDGRWRQGTSSDITQTSYVTSVIAIPCKIGDVFSVSCQGMKVALIMSSRQAYVNPEGVIQSTGFINDSATITCQHDGFLKIQLRKLDVSTLTPVEAQRMEVMWNKGEVIPYEPYQESVAHLSETLRGNGDVKDRIVRKDGTWQIERNIVQYVFNGKENFNKGSSSDTLQSFTFSVGKPFIHGDVLCNYLPYEDTLVASATKESVYDKAENGALYLRVSIERASTVEELQAWLSELYNQGNPLTVQYKMLTPTYEPIQESEQIALHSLESYDTVTYISCDSEVEPTIDVEYGTSHVGGYTLEAWNTAKRNEIEITAMKATHTTTTEEEVTA